MSVPHWAHLGPHFASAARWAEEADVNDYDPTGTDPNRPPLPRSPLGPCLSGRLRQVLATAEGVAALREELAKYGIEIVRAGEEVSGE